MSKNVGEKVRGKKDDKRVKGIKGGPYVRAQFNGHYEAPKDKILVLLSIQTNRYCTSEFLEATTKKATEDYNFTTFLIADQIFWHNLKPTIYSSPEEKEELQIKALKLGEEYFKENFKNFLAPFHEVTRQELLKACEGRSVDTQIELINQQAALQAKPFEIVRWQTWIKKNNFTDSQKELEKLYQTESSLQKGIQVSAEEFVARRKPKNENEKALLLNQSIGYLTEESPAIMRAVNYNFIAYPGEIMPCLQAAKDFFVVANTDPENEKKSLAIPVNDPNLVLNWLDIHFRRYNQPENKTQVLKPLNYKIPSANQTLGGHFSFFSPEGNTTVQSKLSPEAQQVYALFFKLPESDQKKLYPMLINRKLISV